MAAIDKRSTGRWRVRIRNRRAPALSKTFTRKVDAMKYLLTGIKFDSNEAYRMNLIQEIHETKDLFTRAVELAGFICSASPDAIKEVIKNSRIAQDNKKNAISQFDSVQNKLINGKDFKEGIKSFLEKREPYFRK